MRKTIAACTAIALIGCGSGIEDAAVTLDNSCAIPIEMQVFKSEWNSGYSVTCREIKRENHHD